MEVALMCSDYDGSHLYFATKQQRYAWEGFGENGFEFRVWVLYAYGAAEITPSEIVLNPSDPGFLFIFISTLACSADGEVLVLGFNAVSSPYLPGGVYRNGVLVSPDHGITWLNKTPTLQTTGEITWPGWWGDTVTMSIYADWASAVCTSEGHIAIVSHQNTSQSQVSKVWLSMNFGIDWVELRPIAGREYGYWTCVGFSDNALTILVGGSYHPYELYLTKDGGTIWEDTPPAGNHNIGWVRVNRAGIHFAVQNNVVGSRCIWVEVYVPPPERMQLPRHDFMPMFLGIEDEPSFGKSPRKPLCS
jgi:hypothetical protein